MRIDALANNVISNTQDVPNDWAMVQNALLRDIAISLRAIRATLDCHNTVDIPNILRDIRRNTTKPRKRKVANKRRAKR